MTLELDTAAAAIIHDHPFMPSGAWYSRCGHELKLPTPAPDLFEVRVCGLAEAAHAATTLSHDDNASNDFDERGRVLRDLIGVKTVIDGQEAILSPADVQFVFASPCCELKAGIDHEGTT